MLTPNELVFTVGFFLYMCQFSGENGLRYVTVRVCTDRWTEAQMQTGLIICLMLSSIAMRQIMRLQPAGQTYKFDSAEAANTECNVRQL